MANETIITLTISSSVFQSLRGHLSPFLTEILPTKGTINILGMMGARYEYSAHLQRLLVTVTKGDPSEVKTALEQAVKDVSPK